MSYNYDMGSTALFSLRRKAYWGFFRLKNPTASAGCEPGNLGTKGQHATSRPPKPLGPCRGLGLFTAVARVRFRTGPYSIYGAQSVSRAGSCPNTLDFHLSLSFHVTEPLQYWQLTASLVNNTTFALRHVQIDLPASPTSSEICLRKLDSTKYLLYVRKRFYKVSTFDGRVCN
jgi:hypothetical protein